VLSVDPSRSQISYCTVSITSALCMFCEVTSWCLLQVVPCLALHDTMRHIKSDVVTVGFGGCMGMSGFLLAVGKKVMF